MINFPPMAHEVWEIVHNKWTLSIVYTLNEGAMRFSELRRRCEPISQKMLTQTLKDLERTGIVERAVLSTMPPQVQYSLTEIGASFLEAAGAICRWTVEHQEALLNARQQFDEAMKLRRQAE